MILLYTTSIALLFAAKSCHHLFIAEVLRVMLGVTFMMRRHQYLPIGETHDLIMLQRRALFTLCE